jgi:glycosyltransferase involved in cell wall biosynthesis
MEPALRTSGVEARFLGVVPHQTVAQVFGAADVVTLPSFGEGLPSVVCEAMLAGRAVVATPVGGIPEIVRDDVSGRLVPVGDCRALGDALRDLALDRAKRERYGAAAAAFAERHLTWHANALGYHGVYEKVLAHAAHRTVESATRR